MYRLKTTNLSNTTFTLSNIVIFSQVYKQLRGQLQVRTVHCSDGPMFKWTSFPTDQSASLTDQSSRKDRYFQQKKTLFRRTDSPTGQHSDTSVFWQSGSNFGNRKRDVWWWMFWRNIVIVYCQLHTCRWILWILCITHTPEAFKGTNSVCVWISCCQ